MRKKEFQIYIGFLGSTGAGKTTCVNALLGYANLLPSSPNRACTAVVVEVSYNKSNDPKALFRSEIVFITEAEFRVEVEELYADLKAQELEAEDDDGEPEEGRASRIKEMLDKIKVMLPDVRTIEKLQALSVEKILAHPNIKERLGTVQEIKLADRKKFTAQITRIIDSGSSSRRACFWPLIKLVRIFVKKEFLRPGITLVVSLHLSLTHSQLLTGQGSAWLI